MDNLQATQRRFPLGQIYATTGALLTLVRSSTSLTQLLARHQSGDWGEICAEDAQLNNDSVDTGYRLISSYRVEERDKDGKATGELVEVWVITEADRSSTTFLLPKEY